MNNTNILEGLEAVLGLLADATPGEWETASRCDFSTHWEVADCGGPSDHLDGAVKVVAQQMDYCYPAEDDAAAIAAAVNYLRAHGPDLRAGLGDARRYRFLRETQLFKHYVDGELVRVDKIDDNTYDAAIDAAMADAQQQVIDALAAGGERG